MYFTFLKMNQSGGDYNVWNNYINSPWQILTAMVGHERNPGSRNRLQLLIQKLDRSEPPKSPRPVWIRSPMHFFILSDQFSKVSSVTKGQVVGDHLTNCK